MKFVIALTFAAFVSSGCATTQERCVNDVAAGRYEDVNQCVQADSAKWASVGESMQNYSQYLNKSGGRLDLNCSTQCESRHQPIYPKRLWQLRGQSPGNPPRL